MAGKMSLVSTSYIATLVSNDCFMLFLDSLHIKSLICSTSYPGLYLQYEAITWPADSSVPVDSVNEF